MSILINKTIEEIKDRYKYQYGQKDSDNYKEAMDICYSLLSKILYSFTKYKFKERLNELKDIIETKANKLEEDELKICKDKINELSEQIEKVEKNFLNDHSYFPILFYRFNQNYEENEDVNGAKNIYRNIFKELLKQISDLCINYEKIFLSINDLIVDLVKRLKNFI